MSDYDYNDADPAATNGDGGYNSGAGSGMCVCVFHVVCLRVKHNNTYVEVL